MIYFSNQELATTYHVSPRTVRNWIESAKTGKLNLSLQTKGERNYIANTSKNIVILESLAEKGKKYRPHRSQKTVSPQSVFYELYNQEQIYDIVSNLEVNREIPRQYNYFGAGANNWDNYANHLAEEEIQNNLTATIELLSSNEDYIDKLLIKYSQVNVIDLGVGNALPVRPFLNHLLEIGKLGRYIAVDISPSMLEIAENNINKWFDGKVKYEGYNLDIDRYRFDHFLADEYIKSKAPQTANIILFMGGTIQNFRKPSSVLKVIHDSMGVNDFVIHQQKLDTHSSRRYFDFNPNPSHSTLAPNHRFIFNLLNIDESFYEVDMGFDVEKSERYIRVILKIALSVRFKFSGGERIVNFDKNDVIMLWRARQNNALEIVSLLRENELYPLQVSQTDDQEYLLTVSRIKRD